MAQVEKGHRENPDAKAVFVNNPTYYGICSDLSSIVKLAHEYGMYCLVDEAHGTHFYFGDQLPVSAMDAGSDMAAVSMHKSGGSLTQSSVLLIGPTMSGVMCGRSSSDPDHQRLLLFLSSLDVSRRNLALRGKEAFAQVIRTAEYARGEINGIGGYYAFCRELMRRRQRAMTLMSTELAVHTLPVGLAGIEVYDLLRDEYDIQIEFGDLGNILGLSFHRGPGQGYRAAGVRAMRRCASRFGRARVHLMRQEYVDPQVAVSPQDAFYADKVSVELEGRTGRICRGVCYVLSAGDPYTGSGRAGDKADPGHILVRQGKRLLP